jgi:Ca-activated chloride channel family protein
VYRRLPQVQAVDPTYEDDVVVVGLPDLVENEAQTITLKMDAPGGEVDTSRMLASVTLDAGGPLAEADVTIDYSDDPEKLAQQNDDVFIAHRDTVIRSEIARADDQEALADVEDLIEETEVIAGGDTEVTADLKDTVTRIEQGSEEEVREVQEKTTVIHEDDRFE